MQRDWDIAGVIGAPDTPVIGFVERESLRTGTVGDHVKQITVGDLIADSSPLPTIFAILKERQRVLVLKGSQVSGIVTQAALNKPPVRIYLFGLVSLLEMHLAFWVQTAYPDDTWKERLNGDRIEMAMKLYSKRRSRNGEITLLQCLQSCDKRDLVLCREELREHLLIESKTKGKRMLERAEDLRNELAHSQADLASHASWPELIGLVEEIEAAVDQSDSAVEAEAQASGNEDLMLWAAG